LAVMIESGLQFGLLTPLRADSSTPSPFSTDVLDVSVVVFMFFPFRGYELMLRPPFGFMFAFMTAPFRFPETHKLTRLQYCQPWSYLRLVAYSFLGSCEGA